MPDPTDVLPTGIDAGEVERWINLDGLEWKVPALVALLLMLWMVRALIRMVRRRRPARLNPNLQLYGGGLSQADAGLAAKRREAAERIVASASTGVVAGYEIVEQVEAVFVDGFRRLEDAMEGLKAVAAMKGGNALINVRQQRDPGGKCSASGDAVIVRKLGASDDTGDQPNDEPTAET